MRAIILAFDGLLCDTHDVRADAIVQAAGQDGIHPSRDHVLQRISGRSLYEAVEAACTSVDPTGCELITLRAQKILSERMSQGVSVTPNALAWIERQRNAGARLILRTDSLRRDVDRVLRFSELESEFAIVRCVDDLPRTAGRSALESSYIAIGTRLAGLGIFTDRSALECDEFAAGVARRYMDAVSLVAAL